MSDIQSSETEHHDACSDQEKLLGLLMSKVRSVAVQAATEVMNKMVPRLDELERTLRMTGEAGIAQDDAAQVEFEAKQKNPFEVRWEKGFMWPKHDVVAANFLWHEIPKLERVIRKWTKQHRVAIQAGGNIGLFPKFMSPHFEVVYTAEPEPRNFYCMAHNAPEENVIKLQMCFGARHGFASLSMNEENHGNTFMMKNADGAVPIVPIDSLGRFTGVDLIYLDIEGYEEDAVRGAVETIAANRPVLVIEDNGMWRDRGFSRPPGDEIQRLCPGYVMVEQIQSDFVWVPSEKFGVNELAATAA